MLIEQQSILLLLISQKTLVKSISLTFEGLMDMMPDLSINGQVINRDISQRYLGLIRLKRGTDWMTQAMLTIEECVLMIEAIRRGETWVRLEDTVTDRFTQVITSLGREYREWSEGLTDAAIQGLIEEKCRPDKMSFTLTTLFCGRSGWAYSAARHYITIHEGATNLTTSSMRVEIKAITEPLTWLCSTYDHQ